MSVYIAALWLIACNGDGESAGREGAPGVVTVASTLAGCADAYGASDMYGFCLKDRVVRLDAAADAVAVCAEAGEWADACRQGWVTEQERRRRTLGADELLRVCGPNEDCAFQMLDTHPVGDIFAQMDRCAEQVPHYARDCVGHALYRWAAEQPTAEGAARLLLDTTHDPEVVGRFVGAAVTCKGVGSCGDSTARPAEYCRRALQEFTSQPRQCPRAPDRLASPQVPTPPP